MIPGRGTEIPQAARCGQRRKEGEIGFLVMSVVPEKKIVSWLILGLVCKLDLGGGVGSSLSSGRG